jgi:hypothetical protein
VVILYYVHADIYKVCCWYASGIEDVAVGCDMYMMHATDIDDSDDLYINVYTIG